MNLHIKKFEELTNSELYNLLKLRVDVFVVEQNCSYKELDDLDQTALHLWLEEENNIIAYLRILDRGVESQFVSIGRVISSKRNCGYGKLILEAGIKAAVEYFKAEKIYIEAQTYAKAFYEKSGFKQISEEFIMDGIPHLKMIWAKD